MLVLKISGHQLDDGAFLNRLARTVAAMPTPPVIVHGGGRCTTDLAARLGIESRFVEGLRVTDDAVRDVAVMGMVGTASMQLVQALVCAGVPALGLSGVDAGLVRVRKLEHHAGDLGWVGIPTGVAADRLQALLGAGFVPCLAPISLGEDGHIYNVNADHVAQAVASALHADALVFLTNVRGVMQDERVLTHLTPSVAERLIAEGVIVGGMIPKVRAALAALQAGVRAVLMSDLDGVEAFLRGETAGTLVQADEEQQSTEGAAQ
ncbi:MAG: acetylglutamate kinase [Ardenticatenia bacterium]|nr:MAG: acetylglutamate kinase [Ardenticatenia bacterium]